MTTEGSPQEMNDKETYIEPFEILPHFKIKPGAALKRWLDSRRQRSEDLQSAPSRRYDGPWAAMAAGAPEINQSAMGGTDHFYYGPQLNYEPRPLGLAALDLIASARDYASQLGPESSTEEIDG